MPFRYRFLLLALIPCIAALLYFRGQQYDSALIDFRSVKEPPPPASSSPSLVVEKISRPAEVSNIAGFRPLGESRRYTKDNLYEHVDGHAEYFIGAGFAGLIVTDYISAGSEAKQPEIQTEVYDMGKSIQAFGVLADESGDNPQAVSVGGMGYRNSGGLNFIKGRYYVKVSAFSPKAPLLKFAAAFSAALAAGQDSFKAFSLLPDLGKVTKTRFIKEGYRGLDFLHNVIEREYSAGGKKITAALMTTGMSETKALQASFTDYFKKSGIRYEKVGREGSNAYKVLDKYEGNWFLISGKTGLFGVFGTEDEEVLKKFAR